MSAMNVMIPKFCLRNIWMKTRQINPYYTLHESRLSFLYVIGILVYQYMAFYEPVLLLYLHNYT